MEAMSTVGARRALAAALDRADDRWQHGAGSGGYDMSDPLGYWLMLADAVIAFKGVAGEAVARLAELEASGVVGRRMVNGGVSQPLPSCQNDRGEWVPAIPLPLFLPFGQVPLRLRRDATEQEVLPRTLRTRAHPGAGRLMISCYIGNGLYHHPWTWRTPWLPWRAGCFRCKRCGRSR